MMYTNDRDAYRQAFFTAWQKHLKQLPLESVEAEVVAVILLHPEYHSFLAKPNTYQQQEFMLEENPFFHMSLHLALQEQISTNRPAGITHIHQELLAIYINPHLVAHYMMQCLSQTLADAQQRGYAPDEASYLESLRRFKKSNQIVR